jgi:hypothetical protein
MAMLFIAGKHKYFSNMVIRLVTHVLLHPTMHHYIPRTCISCMLLIRDIDIGSISPLAVDLDISFVMLT